MAGNRLKKGKGPVQDQCGGRGRGRGRRYCREREQSRAAQRREGARIMIWRRGNRPDRAGMGSSPPQPRSDRLPGARRVISPRSTLVLLADGRIYPGHARKKNGD